MLNNKEKFTYSIIKMVLEWWMQAEKSWMKLYTNLALLLVGLSKRCAYFATTLIFVNKG